MRQFGGEEVRTVGVEMHGVVEIQSVVTDWVMYDV